MDRWEYQVLVLDDRHGCHEDVLNLQGEDGWDLVSVVTAHSCYLAYMKRKVKHHEQIS